MSTAVKRVAAAVATWSRKAASAQVKQFSAAAAAAPAEKLKAAEAPANAEHIAPEAKSQTLAELTDAQILYLLENGTLSPHKLEADLGDCTRAVHLRRLYTAQQLSSASQTSKTAKHPFESIQNIPIASFDHNNFYKSILNTNCEAVIGYIPLPVGIVGPLLLDGKEYRVPMATVEGALLASTNRGCTAIRKAGGVTSVVQADGMTRAPLVRMPSLKDASALKAWVEDKKNFEAISAAFNSTSRFGRLKTLTAATAGRNVYIRFKAQTGDAMGMNMITKGVNEALALMRKSFPAMRVMALSGNMCTDKKPSAVNWIEGRGKSVSAEVRLSGHVLKSVLKTTAEAVVDLNTSKNLVGSALAGSIGGFNAHASNIVTACYLATGQDAAQNVESSTCLTLLEMDSTIRDPADPDGKHGPGVVMSVTMPSIEVGTVGGGTSLPAQAACLDLLGLRGSNSERPGANAETLARVIAGTVLAGELSLISALTTNDLLNSHLKLNRKPSAAGAGDHSHGHGHHHHTGAALLTPAMQARLAEMNLREKATGVNGASASASASKKSSAAGVHAVAPSVSSLISAAASQQAHTASQTTPAGSVPGGAPAGSHPHPLHLTSHGGHGFSSLPPIGLFAPTSPGRRYFAAPTTQSHAPAHRFNKRSSSPDRDAATPHLGFASFRAGQPPQGGLPVVLEEPTAAADAFDEDAEPCLPVP